MLIAHEERITGHNSYLQIERILNILDGIDSNGLATKQLQMLGRISDTFIFLKEALDKADPWLVSTTTLQNMNSHINNCVNELTNFKNDKNEQRLNNIFSYLEQLLPYFSQVLVTKTPEEIEGIRSAVIKFRQSVGQHLSNLEREINETKTAYIDNKQKLNELTRSIESQKSRIDSIISDFQNQFLKGQTDRNEKYEQIISDAKNDFEDIVQSNREKLDSQIDQQKEIFNTQINHQKEDFNNLAEELRTIMQTELDQIKEMNKEAEKILGLMSMKGLAQGYQKIANSEGWKALLWNVISIGSLIGLLWFGYEFIIKHEGTMPWTDLVSRFILTGVGLTLFTYGAKQASNHRQEERRNRKIELELASLDPYLKDLEPDKQKEVKQTLVDKYFGVELPNLSNQKTQPYNMADSLSNNPQFIKILAEKITNLTAQK